MDSIPSTSRTAIHFSMMSVIRHYHGPEIMTLNAALVNLVRSLEAAERENKKPTSTQGGFHTDFEFINRDDPVIAQFRERVLFPAIYEFLGQYYQIRHLDARAMKPRITLKGWANIMRAGEWNAPHDHASGKNRISAVYYASVPDRPGNEGALQLENPNQIATNHGEYGNVVFQPVEGDLILFPCYQRHFSHPFGGDGERVLLASDVQVHDDHFDSDGYNNFRALKIRSIPPTSE